MLRLQGQQQPRQKRRYLVGLLHEAIPIVFELLYSHRFSSASPLVNFCHPAGPDLHDKSLSALTIHPKIAKNDCSDKVFIQAGLASRDTSP
jgi:hypothetical protein